MSDMNLLTSMAFFKAHQLDRANRGLSNTLDQANANIDEGQRIINRLYAQTLELAADLKEANIVRLALNAAHGAELDAWRTEHPVSHMHDVMGTFKDGDDMRRNFVIWAEMFDATCRSQGIRNPEAFRIG